MDRIYFDNAATTSIDPEVLEAMMPYLTEKFGNPSSIYSYGRESRMAIENARKSVAKLLNAKPAEIFFTSGGTESSNTAINASINDLGCLRIITSPIEHHATLHTAEFFSKKGIEVEYVKLLADGHPDLTDLESLLAASNKKTLVSLMHANNEVGNISDIFAIGKLCKRYHAIFHSDTVQTIGHFHFDLAHTPVDFITAAAHKFHGPKGVGMLYINQNITISPFVHGGAQERNLRAGTENLYGIVGFAKALELSYERLDADKAYISSLREYMRESLLEVIPETTFNGDQSGNGLYTVLSASFPKSDRSEMLLFNLDINNICASGGSACSSGAQLGSHVINSIYPDSHKVTVRFSFCRNNTKEEVNYVVKKLATLI